jgi:hypothetical protein
LSALRSGRALPQKYLLAMVQMERLCNLENINDLIEAATLGLAA